MKYLLLPIFLFVGFFLNAAPVDSLRTEKVDGKLFVIHKVDPQETLFGLARRYKVNVEEIRKFNPSLAEGLKIGDILRIPVVEKADPKEGRKHIVSPGETLFSISKTYNVTVDEIKSYNSLSNNILSPGQELYIPQHTTTQQNQTNTQISVPDPENYVWHKVDTGETLYGLSLVYAVNLENIKRWNNLKGNTLSVGHNLIVGVKREERRDSIHIVVVENKKPADPVDDTVVASTKNDNPEKFKNVEITREVIKNAADFEEIVETGLAELIEDSGNSKKYLALHRTAKVGTIIRVHNEMNGQEVFVRVIGPLPNTSINDKILIKISKAAYDRLAAIDRKFRVRISYFPD